MRPILKDSTSQSVVIRIVDYVDGTPETSVVYNSSGIALWYRREGAVKTTITPATLSALNDAFSSGGLLHIADGYYRLDVPDAAFVTGANGVMIGGTVTGMVILGCYVPLVNYDPYSDALANKIADHVLRRKASNVKASSNGDSIDDASSLYGLERLAHRSNTTDSPGNIRIKNTDGTTLADIPVHGSSSNAPVDSVGN